MELTVHDLWKSFGRADRPALRGVSLRLGPGITALMGPNGSGKSTLLRCLATLIDPDLGTIGWDGLAYTADVRAIRAQLGYLPQELAFPAGLTPRRLLEHLAYLKGVQDVNQPAALLARLGLTALSERPFAQLSGGQVRLVGAAQAFLGHPRLVLLDEPTRGLDVQERERLFALLRQPFPGRLTFFSTQQPGDVTAVTHRLVVLQKGEVCFSGPVPVDMPSEAFYFRLCQPGLALPTTHP